MFKTIKIFLAPSGELKEERENSFIHFSGKIAEIQNICFYSLRKQKAEQVYVTFIRRLE
ncbi:hypothetical protein MHK_002232 [Candidatus Magnetomorum sp. HK-1]|nr:hypothetical protein MHK_002232 [Candidatus Magnetomorum sp. HK-1]